MVSLGHTGRRVVLGHTLNTLRHIITKKSHHVLDKFTILCWAICIPMLSHMWPMGCRLDTTVTFGKADVLFSTEEDGGCFTPRNGLVFAKREEQ